MAGFDAQDFLQRLTSQNYKTHRVGQAKDMAVLTATGDVIGYSVGWNVEPGVFGFMADAQEIPVLLEKLEMFHFAERLEIKALPDLTTMILFNKHPEQVADGAVLGQSALEPGLCGQTNLNGLRVTWLTRKGLCASDLWFILPQAQQPHVAEMLKSQKIVPASEAQFEFYRIRAGWPKRGVDYDEESMILSVGLRLGAAFGKGCYPGQEVVERATAIGSSPQTLATVKLSKMPDAVPPMLLSVEGREAGRVTSIAELDGTILGLGQIRTKQAGLNKAVQVADSPAEIVALY